MSYYSTASSAMEHDTARRLEALDPSPDRLARRLSDIRLDHGRLVHDPAPTVAASGRDESTGEGAASCDEHPPTTATGAVSATDPARIALDRTCLTVKRIAHDIGMPRATLEAYRLGTRRMPQAARLRLGTYLAAHAAMLDGLAQSLIGGPSSPSAASQPADL